MSPQSKEKAKKASPTIVCTRGIDTTRGPFWLYIAVSPEKYEEFIHHTAEKRAPLMFQEYGEILKYGFDEIVPKSVKQEMKEKHGYDESIIQELEKEQTAYLKEKSAEETIRFTELAAMMKQKQQP